LVARGQRIEYLGAGEPYFPVLEAVTELCRSPERERVVGALARYAPSWLAQMPGLAGPGEMLRLRREIESATPGRMLREMRDALEALTADRTVVLVLEDLHWSDHATLDLLAWLARGREPARVFVNISALPPNFDGKPAAADLHVTPDGKFLYASERTSSTVAGFRIHSGTGMLTAIGSVPTEKQPRGFNIDPSGRYLLAVGQLSHSLSSYSIDPASGRLTKLREYPMGKNPNWIEIVDLP
jgi:hypothetical protein